MMGELQTAVQALSLGITALRGVQAADKALSEADLKLKLAEAMSALADAKMALVGVAERTGELAAEIGRLQDALEIKSSVTRYQSAYYETDDEGRPKGDGYCMRCYEVDHRLRHLAYGTGMPGSKVTCPACSASYVHMSVHPL